MKVWPSEYCIPQPDQFQEAGLWNQIQDIGWAVTNRAHRDTVAFSHGIALSEGQARVCHEIVDSVHQDRAFRNIQSYCHGDAYNWSCAQTAAVSTHVGNHGTVEEEMLRVFSFRKYNALLVDRERPDHNTPHSLIDRCHRVCRC